MKSKKNAGKIVAISLGLIAIVVGGFFVYKKISKSKKDKRGELDENNYTPSSPSSSSPSASSPSSSSPSSSEVGCGGAFSSTSFPLQKGSCGDKVVLLQKYLGIDSDGKFGNDTQKALIRKQNYVVLKPVGYSAGRGKVSEADYKRLVTNNR